METSDFIAAFKAGKVCLHPTDTLPGLTVDPNNPKAVSRLYAMKRRPESMPCISLVASIEMAQKWWSRLPEWLVDYLNASGWPEGLSIAWQANDSAPEFLVSAEGTICLRKIYASERLRWLVDVINKLDHPLISTSVNKSGVPPLTTWSEAMKFVVDNDGWVPSVDVTDLINPVPSTVVKMNSKNNGFELLREGAVNFERLNTFNLPGAKR